MVILHVTSVSHGAGKTAICAGLGKLLLMKGSKCGYFKPVIGTNFDTDAAFLKDILSLSDPLDLISPTYRDEASFISGAKVTFEKIARGKDVVLIEHVLPGINQLLPGKTLMIAGYSDIDTLPDLADKKNGSVDVWILNKIPVSQIKPAKTKIESIWTQTVNVLGMLPEDKTLLTFSLSELAQLIEGQIISSPDMKDSLTVNYMLGALTVDSALPYFNRKSGKVAILRAERSDMQMAALATDATAMVLYGETPMIPIVHLRARDKKVLVITTRLNAQAIATRMEETILKTKFNQPGKLPRLIELMSQNLDLPKLYKELGLN